MCEIITSIIIDSAQSHVWAVLTDFNKYENWNPFMKKIKGSFVLAEKLEVTICPPGKKSMMIKPIISKIDAQKEFRWIGKLGTSWLFVGEHYFILEPHGETQTKLIHGEKFSGLLTPLFSLMGGFRSTEKGFIEMNEALKNICGN